jgi:undecaprenyl-diphosphatase
MKTPAMYPFESLNRTLFLQLNGKPDAPPWQVMLAVDVADYLILLIPLLLLVMWFRGGRARRESALKAVAVTVLALGIGQIVGLLLPHPRPFMIGLGHAWMVHVADASFPSDHATVFASVALSVLLDGAVTLAAATFVAGAAVAWARIFLGVHFPFDMLGAVLVAALAAAVLAPLWRQWGTRLADLAERLYRLIFARPIAAGRLRS